MRSLILPVVQLNKVHLTSHLRLVLQGQTSVLLHLRIRIRIQIDHQGLLWIRIQIKRL